mgnify:CR=1 FL=1
MTASLVDIRRFLLNHFDDGELNGLCFDHFHEVYQDFTADMTLSQKGLLLLGYCQRRDLLPALLAILKRERPEPYRRVFGRASSAVSRVNINSAAAEELRNLPGIGSALAASIVAARPFAAVEGLARVPGIGPKRLAAVRDWCEV